MDITFRQEILDLLSTPFSWAIVEMISFILFVTCMIDAYRNNDDKIRMYRVLELFGYVLYSGLFENVGVLIGVYDYSLDRLFMFGAVPLEILLLEATIFYVAMRLCEKRKLSKWATPFVVGVLCVLQDLTIDPVAVFDLHNVNGVLEGQWNWAIHYTQNLFGIPYYNFTGWFIMMFYYAGLLLIGRRYFEKSEFKHKQGITYVFLAPLCGIILICSPITNFILFLEPFVEIFNRTAEITMLSIVMGISIIIMLKEWKPKEKINWKDNSIIWWIPAFLHLLDIVYALILQIDIAYIPVFVFGGLHMLYIARYLTYHPKFSAFIARISNKNVVQTKAE
jgi:uncharacterized membrane protein